MIFYDTTNAVRSGHFSGLQRVSARIRAELQEQSAGTLTDVVWKAGGWRDANTKAAVSPVSSDLLLTPEVFGPGERDGFSGWIENPGCRTAAVYYDAIPLKFPAITWPKSVARHPAYMKQLARFDRVLAISRASKDELVSYWQWSRPPVRATVTSIPLGADADGMPRTTVASDAGTKPSLLMVGIIEPRKNQSLMLGVCEQLWKSGLEFDLHLIGRVNPHFGRPIMKRAKKLAQSHPGLKLHGALNDRSLRAIVDQCRFAVFPSLAEGNGLPVLEALWQGLPCVCSRIPALEENAAGGGCVLIPPDSAPAWADTLREMLTDDAQLADLRRAALARPLPTWADSARAVLAALGD